MTEKTSPSRHWHPAAVKVGCVSSLLVGLFLLNQPDDPDRNPEIPYPWPYLLQFVPSWYGDAFHTFWVSIGAALIVLALDNYPALQTPFNWSFSQYLGDLSFGIYAMHIIIHEAVFKPVLNPWRQQHLGEGYFACFAVETFATILVLWAADYFTRADKLVVRIGRWLEVRTFQRW